MPFSVSVIDPLGGLDRDSDLARVKNGDYVDAKNICHISQGGQTTWAIENTLGNKLRFTIPSTVQQNKIYQIILNKDAGSTTTLNIYNTQGVLIGTTSWLEAGTYLGTLLNANAALAVLAAALLGLPQAYVLFYTNTGVTNRQINISLTSVLGYDWTLSINNSNQSVIVQEAISLEKTGEPHVIGSYDLLGDLFIWSTPNTTLPSILPPPLTFTTASSGAPNKIRVSTSNSHGLLTGQEIVISGVTGAGAASTNGRWIVDVITITDFDLQNSAFVAPSIGGVININVTGIGEIGVATYDANTDTTTYYTLLKSKEFNFTTKHQVDTYCEENNFRRSIYWTDDYNVPRVFYYSGPYMNNGGLSIVNPEGLYEYGTIASETKLIITNELLSFIFTGQTVGGGAVLSGNWRYSIRLLTATFSATNWTELGNPINVYKADQTVTPQAICGDDALVTTPKINQFSVSGIPVDIFKFIELAGVNYVNGAIVGSIIKRIAIDGTTMTIQHTGNEANVTNLDVTTLNQFSFDIQTAKNIDAIDNRLILSNLTTAQEKDFSGWTETWTHSVKQDTIDSIAVVSNPAFGEYQNPINVYSKAGYMLNDTYRFGAKFLLKSTGNFTKVFWIDDIRIDDSAANINPGRRVAGLPNMNITTTGAGTQDVYVPYVEFSGIDLDVLIDGVPVRDLISSIHIEVVERVKEVLITGQAVLTVTGLSNFPGTQVGYPGTGVYYGEFPYITNDMCTGGFTPYVGSFTAPEDRTIAKLYSPDVFCGQSAYPIYAPGDKFICFGQGETMGGNSFLTGGNAYYSGWTEYNGFFNVAPAQVALTSDTQVVVQPTQTITIGPKTYQVGLSGIAPTAFFNQRGGLVMVTAATFAPTGPNTDYGFYYGQYFRERLYPDPDNSKYGNRNENIYMPTGAILDVNSSVSSPASISVFGGDVMVQKTFIKVRASDGTVGALGGGGGVSFYSQNVVNSQMMRKYNLSSSAWVFPNTSDTNWLEGVAGDLGTSLAPYNKGYTIQNGISVEAAYDPNLPDQSDLPTQIRYSDLKPQNSIIDNFRVFLPLNFKDLPMTFGEITHHMNFNGELFTWQLRRVQRQYFNTRGTMQVDGQNPTKVLIGDGTVFSRDGQTVSVIGTGNKWSVIKGKSAQGNDTAYWINTELKKAMRMGYDGTISVSDIHGMQSFFANNLKWVNGKDTPADGEGICGVWDDRYKEIIWTIMGKRVIQDFTNIAPTIAIGDIGSYTPTIEFLITSATNATPIEITTSTPHGLVTGCHVFVYGVSGNDAANGNWVITSTGLSTFTLDNSVGNGAYTSGGIATTFLNFERTGEYYVAIINHITDISMTPEITPSIWQPIPHTGSVTLNGVTYNANDYYNEYTIAFNEQKNKFTAYYTHKPKIYLKWTDTFFSPRPISNTGEVYEHRLGDYCVWYSDGVTSQTEDGFIELLFNRDENLIKEFFAVLINSEIVPERIDFTTKSEKTFIVASDWETYINFFTSAIKNDILTSSNGLINTEDTSALFGQYLLMKITFKAMIYQKVLDIVVKFMGTARVYKK